jgi:hypothetical protein
MRELEWYEREPSCGMKEIFEEVPTRVKMYAAITSLERFHLRQAIRKLQRKDGVTKTIWRTKMTASQQHCMVEAGTQ